jgi:membrane fusion protein (multidrug efflux system)
MNYENEQRLQEGNVVGDVSVQTVRNALLEAEAALVQAQAQERNARNSLSYTEVKSPVSGVASMIPWHVGSLVSSNISEPLVTVADDHEMYAYFSITENQALDLIGRYGSIAQFVSQAPEVSLKLSNGSDYQQKGRINAVSGTVDDATGAVTLRATFPNPNRLLHNGGSGSIVVTTHRKGCIVVPQEATYELQNRVFVYKVVDGKTKATPVELFRLNDGHQYVVEQGLNVGDTIIAEGAGLLKDGIEVRGKK